MFIPNMFRCRVVILLGVMLAIETPSGAGQESLPPNAVQVSEKNDSANDELAVQKLQLEITSNLKKQLSAFEPIKDSAPDAVSRYSQRGDLHMFLAMFPEAVADYQKMSELDPASDASHWRLGIALFYASKPDKAAAQFDKYHSFDNVDRENGIWRYFSHYRAFGAEKAREQLLKYEKDDRPPFPEVYRLFEGNMTPEQVLAAIPEKLDAKQRQPLLFYSNLYIGLNHVVEGQPEPARAALLKAIQNDWPKSAGYGPDYMWHVGRLQYFELLKKKAEKKTE